MTIAYFYVDSMNTLLVKFVFFFSFFFNMSKKYSTIYCTKCNIKVLQVFLAEKEECRYFLEWTNGLLLYLEIALLGKKSESTQEL